MTYQISNGTLVAPVAMFFLPQEQFYELYSKQIRRLFCISSCCRSCCTSWAEATAHRQAQPVSLLLKRMDWNTSRPNIS